MTEEGIIILDEYRQRWICLPGDPLWFIVQEAQTKQPGEVVVLPLSVISKGRGWGWWTVFQDCSEYIENLGVPQPNLETFPSVDTLTTGDLSELLQRFGGYLAYLETIKGQIESRRSVLKESYDSAMLVATAELDGKLTEKAKEASVLQANETLKQTRRRFIEEEAKLYTIKGLRDAYKALWDSCSRILTVRQLEAQLATGRVP